MTRKNVTLFAVTAVMVGCLPDYPSDARGRWAYDEQGARGSSPPRSAPSSGGSASSAGPPPELGPTVRQADPPPPLSGGTLAVAPDGHTVVAADPDRDRIYVTDVTATAASAAAVRTIDLALHDEPGRVVVDGANRAHVALRKGGAVVTVDLTTATVLARRAVCRAPRGIAWSADTDLVHVACAEGELVSLPAAGGAEVKRRTLPLDLRDVVVTAGGLTLSTFREARLFDLRLDTGALRERTEKTNATFGRRRVAWRMVAAPPLPSGGAADVIVAAQKAPDSQPTVPVPAVPAGYYQPAENGCANNGPGPVVVDREESIHVPPAVLAVDVAATSEILVLAAAGNGHTPSLPQLVFVDRSQGAGGEPRFGCDGGRGVPLKNAQITSVAFALGGEAVVALSREPAAMIVVDAHTLREVSRVALSSVSREDTGHAVFHSNSGLGLACASCHPDGRDDAQTWRSIESGARRTPSLLGTLPGTAPYHWNGEAKDLSEIMRLTFQSRMRGPELAADQMDAVNAWVTALPAMPAHPVMNQAAGARGQALFEGAGNCTQCHSGPMHTNNESVDAHTGGVFQVPSLVGVSWRLPLLHDGSAATVRALLEKDHGEGHLQPAQIADLTAYVESL